MNEELFAKGLENLRMLTRLLGENVENFDDYGCPKIRDLVKMDSSWIWYPFRHKARLHCVCREECKGVWRMGYATLVFFCTCLLCLCLLLTYFFQLDMVFFYSIHFKKLSLRNRWLIKKIILILVKLSLTTTIESGNLGPVWDKPLPDHWLWFCPNFFSFCWSPFVAFGKFTFQKLVTKHLFGLDFCAV